MKLPRPQLKSLKKKTYIIQVPRRGGSIVIGKIKAKDVVDARTTLLSNIDQFIQDPRLEPVIKQTKYFHLIDAETGEKIKVENPLYSEPEDDNEGKHKKKQKEIDIEDLQKMLNLELAETLGKTMVNVIGSSIGAAMNMVAKTMGEVMAEVMKAQAEALKQSLIVKPQEQQPMQQLEAVRLILELVKNWPAIKQYGPEIIQYFKQNIMAQMGGDNGSGQDKEGGSNA